MDWFDLLINEHITAGATQVKWNRHNGMYLASAHNGEVRIWDIRVCFRTFEIKIFRKLQRH
jgi:hypothetical protein